MADVFDECRRELRECKELCQKLLAMVSLPKSSPLSVAAEEDDLVTTSATPTRCSTKFLDHDDNEMKVVSTTATTPSPTVASPQPIAFTEGSTRFTPAPAASIVPSVGHDTAFRDVPSAAMLNPRYLRRPLPPSPIRFRATGGHMTHQRVEGRETGGVGYGGEETGARAAAKAYLDLNLAASTDLLCCVADLAADDQKKLYGEGPSTSRGE